jgi:hypothetical protein
MAWNRPAPPSTTEAPPPFSTTCERFNRSTRRTFLPTSEHVNVNEQKSVRGSSSPTITDALLVLLATLAMLFALLTSANPLTAGLFAAVIAIHVGTGVTGRRERGVGIGRAGTVVLVALSGVVILWTLVTGVRLLLGPLVVGILWMVAAAE